MRNFYQSRAKINERELFDRLKNRLIPDLQSTGGKYDRTDCSSQNAKLQIELKCRRTHYDELLIEKKKFDALLAIAASKQFGACYINSTPNGVYGWNLNAMQIEWQGHEMPATTDFQNVQTVEKIVGFLPISKAICLSGAIDF